MGRPQDPYEQRSNNQHGHNPRAERDPDNAERARRVVELRRKRMTYSDIGKELGISAAYVHRLYNRAMAEVPAQQVDEHRAEELILIDDAVADLLVIARGGEDGNASYRSRIEAWSVIRSWAERKAKLLGLDAPTQTVHIDKIDAEIANLTRELATLDTATEQPWPEPDKNDVTAPQ